MRISSCTPRICTSTIQVSLCQNPPLNCLGKICCGHPSPNGAAFKITIVAASHLSRILHCDPFNSRITLKASRRCMISTAVPLRASRLERNHERHLGQLYLRICTTTLRSVATTQSWCAPGKRKGRDMNIQCLLEKAPLLHVIAKHGKRYRLSTCKR